MVKRLMGLVLLGVLFCSLSFGSTASVATVSDCGTCYEASTDIYVWCRIVDGGSVEECDRQAGEYCSTHCSPCEFCVRHDPKLPNALRSLSRSVILRELLPSVLVIL